MKLKKIHNKETKQFMQKILIYIDTIFVNTANAQPENASRVLTGGILNVRDAILSEVIKDNNLDKINDDIEKNLKKSLGLEEKNQNHTNQEIELDKDQ